MIGIIIQARMESRRLPGKVYEKILDKHLIEFVILRVKMSKLAKKIIVAIPDTKKSAVLVPLIKKNKVDFYSGSLDNVLDRYIKTAEKFKLDIIVRITADCPLIDPVLIDQIIEKYLNSEKRLDFLFIKDYPFGLGDIEVISLKTLKRISRLTKSPFHCEHVVSFISERPDLFRLKVEKAPPELSRPDLRVCVDEPQDLDLVKKIFTHFKPREDFTTREILEYLDKNPKVANINKDIKHNFIIPNIND
ncbi:MAG: glycosyltransferase family protein [Candidatus Staskawiczbacteria bacterium]|nr:glycosyltransferase family protein [Candidatus Staskawiczbacteria bacterium]